MQVGCRPILRNNVRSPFDLVIGHLGLTVGSPTCMLDDGWVYTFGTLAALTLRDCDPTGEEGGAGA